MEVGLARNSTREEIHQKLVKAEGIQRNNLECRETLQQGRMRLDEMEEGGPD